MTTQLDRNSVDLLRGLLDTVESGFFAARLRIGSDGVEQASQCRERLDLLCSLYDQLMGADNANELAWTRDVAGCEETSDLLNILWSRWLALADLALAGLRKCVGHNVPPDQVARLSQLIIEVRAFLNPSDVLAGGMLAIRDAAVAEYARGEFLEGLVD